MDAQVTRRQKETSPSMDGTLRRNRCQDPIYQLPHKPIPLIMADQKPIIEISIYQENEDTSTLKASGIINAPIKAIFMPLATLVDRMIDILDENPEATMRDMGINPKSKEEVKDV